MKLLEKVLGTIMTNDIKIKVNKCEFFKQQVTFFGHIIIKEGIKKSPKFNEKFKMTPNLQIYLN